MEKLLSAMLSMCILLQAYQVRRTVGTWLFPACLYGLFWFLMTFVPIVVLPLVPTPAFGVFLILLMAVAFSFGSLSVDWHAAARLAARPTIARMYDHYPIRLSLLLSMAMAIVCLLVNSRIQGISFDRMFTFDAAVEYTENRYSGDLISNIFLQMATVLSYVSAALAGLVFGGVTGWRRAWILFLGLAPSVFVLLTQSAKGAFVLSIAILYGGVLARRINERQFTILAPGTLRRIGMYSLILFPLIALSFVGRGALDRQSLSQVTDSLLRYFASYTSAHLYAFCDWANFYGGLPASQMFPYEKNTNGFYTLMAVFKLFGDNRPVPPGTFDEYFQYGYYVQSNVYTMYRGLITDFGVVGGMVFMTASGVLVHQIYASMIRRIYPSIATGAFLVFIAATYSSAYISVFQYNSIFVFGLIMVFILAVNRASVPVGASQIGNVAGNSV
ncbi:oligosaccharide repeat unit polymerase [Sphingomonas panacisoli]|uniref:Oligosaccharide repeat unit polymerase n=1 Tax=Sphingomonas panacisoli TaxID=1813879 RepID=A0A5B8LIH4_9SPHN|nr:O-antigen polymerase [Sphingomonas panacisoli]QDZ06950.1 oligosaccharide repeat unit polymerase [Sphingomonas panacisoli]